MNRHNSPVAMITASVLLGLLLALVWTWASSQIYGYFAINRFADHWPIAIRTVAPGLLFVLIVVLPTLFIIRWAWPRGARAIVWLSITLYAISEVATFVFFGMNATAWLILAMTVALIVIVGMLLQPVRFWRQPSDDPR
jgi:hypothetical protein